MSEYHGCELPEDLWYDLDYLWARPNDDGTFTTVVRTLTSTTETVNYSEAQQVTDFGAVQSSFFIDVYQVSATLGRGYPARGSF